MAKSAEIQCNLFIKDTSEKLCQTRFKICTKSVQTEPKLKNKCVMTDPDSESGPSCTCLELKPKVNVRSYKKKKNNAGTMTENNIITNDFKKEFPLPLECILDILSQKSDLAFSYLKNYSTSTSTLEVFRNRAERTICGLEDVPVCIKFKSDGTLSIVRVFKQPVNDVFWDFESCTLREEAVSSALNFLTTSVFCTGISNNTELRKSQRLETFTYPCVRRQANTCPVVFKPSTRTKEPFQCSNCLSLERYMKRLAKKTQDAAITELKRQSVNSSCPISDLNPKSRNIRLNNLRTERHRQKIKIKKLEEELKETRLQLAGKQRNELSHLLDIYKFE